MADNKPKTEKKEKKTKGQSTTLSGTELIVMMSFIPVVLVWLVLAARIIWSATGNPEVLDKIEGLLTALAVLTIPVTLGFAKIFERMGT